MNDYHHTILCVDDEQNILRSLERLLRRESYRILTATGGADGLKVLEENEVHLVISDQRMPGMSGTEFLANVKERHPGVIQFVLSGYTDVDAITEAINKGHIHKFILKPWNDENLRLEIRQGLEHYDLIQSNMKLNETVVQQNEELRAMNGNLEELVKERTRKLEIQNQALELSHAVLEDLPIPVIGISSEMMIVLINGKAQTLRFDHGRLEVGKRVSEAFSDDVVEKLTTVFETGVDDVFVGCRFPEAAYDLDLIPLSGRFQGHGVMMTLRPSC